MGVTSQPLADAPGGHAPGRDDGDWAERADDFSQTIVRPVGLVVDRLGPTAPGALVLIREFLRLADRAGFTTLTEPPEEGGAGLSGRDAFRALAILSEGDAALGTVIALSRAPARCVTVARRLDPRAARHAEVPLPISDRTGCVIAPGRGTLRLRRDGSGWRLSGRSRDAVAGAAIASHAAVGCVVEGAGARPVAAIVPLNRPGVRRTLAPRPSPGRRSRAAAALMFDELWLEPERVLDAGAGSDHAGGGADHLGSWLRATGHLTEALAAFGLARGAERGAARWRAEHALPAVPALSRLGRSLTHAESALGALSLQVDSDSADMRAVAHQALSLRLDLAETAVAVTRLALVSCGPEAARAEGVRNADRTYFRPEKLLRDALADGSDRILRDRPRHVAAPSPSTRSVSWAT